MGTYRSLSIGKNEWEQYAEMAGSAIQQAGEHARTMEVLVNGFT